MYKDKVHKAEREWSQMLKFKKDLEFCLIQAEYEQSLLVMVYQFGSIQGLKRSIQSWMLEISASADWLGSVGWVEADGIQGIKQKFEMLYRFMDWNITLGQDVPLNWRTA